MGNSSWLQNPGHRHADIQIDRVCERRCKYRGDRSTSPGCCHAPSSWSDPPAWIRTRGRINSLAFNGSGAAGGVFAQSTGRLLGRAGHRFYSQSNNWREEKYWCLFGFGSFFKSELETQRPFCAFMSQIPSCYLSMRLF